MSDTACGLDHQAVYRRNTGKLPTYPRLRRMDQSCKSWSSALRSQEDGTLSGHAIIGRFWDAHMQDLGGQ